ncbi:DinB family protein [Streptomyces sp. NPDC057694]|uniref:DinB family protein n=1 Tax=Streptomyces sp. NPDC057694 TaxID=3346216 RepID=UPI00368DBB6F
MAVTTPAEVANPEIKALLSALTDQRDHVLGILEGLDDDALRRPVLPSGWDCLGLVRHLTLDVERFWFLAVFLGDEDVIASFEGLGDSWQVPADATAAEVLDAYRTAARDADAVIGAAVPDAPPAWWPADLFGPDYRLHDLRELLLHVITETACHAGHLDAARELLDGRRWLTLT